MLNRTSTPFNRTYLRQLVHYPHGTQLSARDMALPVRIAQSHLRTLADSDSRYSSEFERLSDQLSLAADVAEASAQTKAGWRRFLPCGFRWSTMNQLCLNVGRHILHNDVTTLLIHSPSDHAMLIEFRKDKNQSEALPDGPKYFVSIYNPGLGIASFHPLLTSHAKAAVTNNVLYATKMTVRDIKFGKKQTEMNLAEIKVLLGEYFAGTTISSDPQDPKCGFAYKWLTDKSSFTVGEERVMHSGPETLASASEMEAINTYLANELPPAALREFESTLREAGLHYLENSRGNRKLRENLRVQAKMLNATS